MKELLKESIQKDGLVIVLGSISLFMLGFSAMCLIMSFVISIIATSLYGLLK